MNRRLERVCVGLVTAGWIALTSVETFAQVWAVGPNGQLGYITTNAPTSPGCGAPRVWSFVNGHYTCQNPPPPPPPTCPPGYVQTSAPSWNGSSWVGLVCQPALPPITPADQKQACVNYGLANGFYKGGLGQRLWSYGGPIASQGASAYNGSNFAWLNPNSGYDYVWVGKGSFNPPNVPTQMYYFNDGVVNICFFTPGTTSIVGFINVMAGTSGGGGG